jgi:hypothetical protein
MGYLQIKKPVRMAISHASKGPKRDISVGIFVGTLKMNKI